jgi:uncharacterized phage protein (TIGR01671 family)
VREIKFRAWVEEMVDVKVIDWRGDTYMPKPGIMDQRNDLYFFEDYPDMLMQFTGLKDKNGVEIYEGDIDREYGVVVYDKATFGFKGKDSHGHDSILILQWAEEREIIGNIHENKELLK